MACVRNFPNPMQITEHNKGERKKEIFKFGSHIAVNTLTANTPKAKEHEKIPKP